MTLPDPGHEDIPIEINTRPSLPLPVYFKQLAAIATVLVLTVGLGVAVKLSQNYQGPSKAGSGLVDRVDLSVNKIDSIKYGLSAQAVGNNTDAVNYQWGVSSTNSIGTLDIHSSQKYAEFTLNGNPGRADIWVAVDGGITNSYAIAMGPDGPYIPTPATPPVPSPSASVAPSPTPLSTSTPTPTPTPLPTIDPSDTRCQSKGGNWTSQYSDCENIDKNACTDLNGLFNECASACRYQQDPSRPCITLCVRVCKLPPLPTTTPVPVNNAPVITTDYLPTVYTDEDYSAEITATDADGDSLNMEFSNLPGGITKNLCKQTMSQLPTQISCELSGWVQFSKIDMSRPIGVRVTDSRGTVVNKTLYMYISSPQPAWISWNTKSVNIYGGVDLKVDGKKYKMDTSYPISPDISIENVTSMNTQWRENGFDNTLFLGFGRDDDDWWISFVDYNIGGKTFTRSGEFYKTSLGRPVEITEEFGDLKLQNMQIQAFTDLNFDPVLETEKLPVARLFGLYSGTISVSDRNIYDYPTVEISNLPMGLIADNCIKQQDQSILHCLITGRPLFIGDTTILIKINGVDNQLVLPVRFSNPEPPKPPGFIISEVIHWPVFVVGKSSPITVEISNVGGSTGPIPVISIVSKNGQSSLNPNSECNQKNNLDIGQSCNLMFDQIFSQVGDQTFSIEGLSNDNDSTVSVKVASSNTPPLTISTKIPGIHQVGEQHASRIGLFPKNSDIAYPFETNFVYSAESQSFVATIELPVELTSQTFDISIKLDKYLRRSISDVKIELAQIENIDTGNTNAIPGDFNDDNKLTMADISLLLSQYTSLSTPVNAQNRRFDINSDGFITMADITMVLSNYTQLVTTGD